MHEPLEAADEELLVDDHNDDRQQQLRQPHCDMVADIELWQRPAPHHVPHREIHQDEQEAKRREKPALQHRRVMVGKRVLLGGAALLHALDGCAVARILHGLDDRVG